MYNTTNAFNEAILGDNRKFLAKIKYENTEITDGFVSIKHTMQSHANNVITVGSAFSSYVEVEMWKPDILLDGKEIEISIGIEREAIEELLDSTGNEILDSNRENIYTLNGSDGIEWVPLGLFTVQKPENDNGIIKFTAYDRIQSKISGAYFSELTYPTDAKNILAEIQEKTGIEIDTSGIPDGVKIEKREVISNNTTDSEGNQTTTTTYENPFNGYTYRETLGYIAMLYCKFVIADRSGAIKFVWYDDVSYNINTDRYYDDLKVTETVFQVEKISCTGYNNKSYEAGSGTTNIQLNNPVMTQERLNYIYNQIKDMQFIPASTSFYGDVRLDVGDTVTVNSKDGNTIKIPIMNITQEYDGGLLTAIQSYGGSTESEQTKGPTLERLDRTYTELFLVKEIVGTKADFEYVHAIKGEFEEIVAKKADFDYVHGLEGDFEKLSAKQADFESATVKRLEAEEIKVKNLETEKLSLKELDAENAKLGYLTADKADLAYATIDFSNVKEQVVGSTTIKDGAITNVKIADATIEAAKIKTINADTITTGTLKTSRLIITGEDGQDSIVKAINTANGVPVAEVNGQKIQAASIDVVDLSAFKATIAQFILETNAIYSGKTSITDPSSGIYLSTTGIGVGNGELAGITESPVQIYSEGSIKLQGKNALIDFNTVLGELNIEATSVKIKSGTGTTTDVANYINESTELIQNAQGWQLNFDKLIKSDEADVEKHQNYITLQNGNVILGSSDSNIKLTLFNDKMLLSDVDGTSLAKFEKNSVALGMDGTESVIDLCNGTGTLSNVKPEEGYKRLAIKSEDSVEILTDHMIKMGFPSDNASAPSFVMTSDSIPWDEYSLPLKMILMQVGDGKTVLTSEIEIHNLYAEMHSLVGTASGEFAVGGYVRTEGDSVNVSNLISHGNISLESGDVILPNARTLRARDTTGVDRALAGISNANDINYGYGTYQIGNRYTYLYGGAGIIFRLKSPETRWTPYLCAGNSIDIPIGTTGYITNSGKDVYFVVPISVPIVGNPTVSVSSINGITVRQNNKYLYGSSASEMIKPSSYIASVINTKSGVQVIARMPNTTNVTNNESCGIYASIKITFS